MLELHVGNPGKSSIRSSCIGSMVERLWVVLLIMGIGAYGLLASDDVCAGSDGRVKKSIFQNDRTSHPG